MKLVEKIKLLREKNEKAFKLMILAIFALLLTIIGTTYAYFAGVIGGGTNANIQANTGTTDSLTFIAGDPIKIHATDENFKEGMDSLSGTTHATAILKANNTTNEAKGKYNVFFVVEQNNFEYTTSDGQAEIILKVTDPNGNEVTNITGLKRVENGFDITTRSGAFLITSDYDIEATPSESTKEQRWNFEVILVNLDSDQNKNKGKKLDGYVYITQEKLGTYKIPVINTINSTNTHDAITATLNITPGTEEIGKYYYAIEEKEGATGEVEYKEHIYAEYDFEDLKPDTEYILYSYVEDKQGMKSNYYNTTVVTNEYVLPVIDDVLHTVTLNSITVKASTTKGSEDIVKYYYSKDDGATWEESTEATHTFTNLLDTTEYKIKIKVEDKKGKFSTEYYEAIATETYINPSITNVVTKGKAYNSLTLEVTANNGTNTIEKYYFSKDNGVTWEESTNNSFTFTELEENTEYTILVKVSDTNKRESIIYNSYKETTDEYVIPTIDTVEVERGIETLALKTAATSGSEPIAKYYYSKDNGSNWEESNSENFLFDELTIGTPFSLKVKVSDIKGRESTEYILNTKTRNTLFNVNKETTNEIFNYRISEIVFEDSIIAHNDAEKIIDVSETKNNDLVAYLINSGETHSSGDAYYITYIQSSEKINANINSSNWFANIGGLNLVNITNLAKLNTEYTTNMNGMFAICSELKSLDVSNFNTSQVTDMSAMFLNCNSLINLDLSSFDTSQVINMSQMFSGDYYHEYMGLKKIIFGEKWNTSQVTDMYYMFYYCRVLTELDVSSFDTSQVTDMGSMFERCGSLTELDISNWNTSNVTNMSSMFALCASLTELDVSNFDTSQVENMNFMFNWCSALTTLDLGNFDTSQVIHMYGMFGNCNNLTTLDLSNFDTSQLINMDSMFSGCKSLMNLDLSGKFDITNVEITNYSSIFAYVPNGINIYVKDNETKTFIESCLSNDSVTGTVTIKSI